MKLDLEKLKEIRFLESGPKTYLSSDGDYLLNVKTRELFFLNDGYGEPELLLVVDDMNHLIFTLESIGYKI
jgi:hypothetical protein